MEQYTIYCKREQTKKAFELGADLTPCRGAKKNFIFASNRFNSQLSEKYCIPTAEQMLGWLEEEEKVREICIQRYGDWVYQIYIYPDILLDKSGFDSRKEATLAAIDAALEYLTNQKTK